jgi:hypothetical protein
MWKSSLHVHDADVDSPAWRAIQKRLLQGFKGLEKRIGHIHVRLYGDRAREGVHTCYIRIDLVAGTSLARGDAGHDLDAAVERAVSRVRTALIRADVRPPTETGAPI